MTCLFIEGCCSLCPKSWPNHFHHFLWGNQSSCFFSVKVWEGEISRQLQQAPISQQLCPGDTVSCLC